MLRKYNFNKVYNSKTHDIIEEFYVPALKRSIRYDRISAYFDSKILRMYSVGIEEILNNNGKIRFIFSSEISAEDYEQIKKGYELKKIYEDKLLNSIHEEDFNIDLSNLTQLIERNVVEVKIAFTKEGVFHDKYGIFEDVTGDKLYFRGSNNETVAAILKNFESFETSLLSDSEEGELLKINTAVEMFEKIWNNEMEGIQTLDIPNCVREKMITYSRPISQNVYQLFENAITFDINDDGRFIILNTLENGFESNQYKYLHTRFLKPHVIDTNQNQAVLKISNYIVLNQLISMTIESGKKLNVAITVSKRLRRFLHEKDMMLDKRKNLGIAIKRKDSYLTDDFNNFQSVVSNQLERVLRLPQMWDAYFAANMIKSSNFSVPGSGKTSVIYGAFSYLEYIGKVDKIVMIGPKNSFTSWKKEFRKNFGNKKELKYLDIHEKTDHTKKTLLKYESDGKNLILINYESTPNLKNEISKIVDEKTFLVFDEVHRIKGFNGERAQACLSFSKNATYKVVLTGTPIPNSYLDIYNMLKILYQDEYNSFFGFKSNDLKNAHTTPSIMQKINEKIFPFFVRTTKNDLNVPLAFPDDLESGMLVMDDKEEKIFKIVHETFNGNPLLLFIRLLQASSNPMLILEKIDKKEFSDSFDEDSVLNNTDIIDFSEEIKLSQSNYDFIREHGKTRKLDYCAELIKCEVHKGKQIIAWGMFVKNLYLMKEKLIKLGVNAAVISGETPLNERDKIIEDFENGQWDVLISNPHTLAESISLHKTSHHAFYFEFGFNLTHMLQSRDRIHRLGITDEEKPRYTYMFLNSKDGLYDSIDLRVYDRLKKKENIMKEAVEGNDVTYIEDNYLDDIKYILNLK